jgi:hypothetical protein
MVAGTSGVERREIIIKEFESKLIELDDNYIDLADKANIFTGKDKEKYNQLELKIEYLYNLFTRWQASPDNIRWMVNRQSFYSNYIHALKTYKYLLSRTK